MKGAHKIIHVHIKSYPELDFFKESIRQCNKQKYKKWVFRSCWSMFCLLFFLKFTFWLFFDNDCDCLTRTIQNLKRIYGIIKQVCPFSVLVIHWYKIVIKRLYKRKTNYSWKFNSVKCSPKKLWRLIHDIYFLLRSTERMCFN